MSGTVHLEPIVYQARFYAEGDSYEARDPYVGVATILVVDDQGFISGLHGRVTRRHWHALARQLKARGIATIASLRHKRQRTYRVDDWLKPDTEDA